MAALERADKAIIRSRFSVRGYAFPDHKNGIGEALDIVAIFHSDYSFKLALLRFTSYKFLQLFQSYPNVINKFWCQRAIDTCSVSNVPNVIPLLPVQSSVSDVLALIILQITI
jgi:hypothetical protein